MDEDEICFICVWIVVESAQFLSLLDVCLHEKGVTCLVVRKWKSSEMGTYRSRVLELLNFFFFLFLLKFNQFKFNEYPEMVQR